MIPASATIEPFAKRLTFSCVYPYFSGIPKVKWYTFTGASHCSNVEIPGKYVAVIAEFLLSNST